MNMNALAGLGVTPFNGYGDMQEKPKKKNGLMNALSTLFEYGAPEAFEAGRQKKHQRQLSGALQNRDFGGAADAAFASGNIDGGLSLLDYQGGMQAQQSEAAQAEKMQKLQGMAAFTQNMRQIPEAERGRWAMDNWQMLEPIVGKDFMTFWQESGGDVSDASLDEDLLAIQTALGQGPAAPVEGKVVNNRLVDPTTGDVIGDFSDPKQTAFKTIELADGVYQYDPADPRGTMQKMGAAPAKKPMVSINNTNTPEMPSKDTLTPFQLKQDQIYAQTLAEWNTGGGADAAKNIGQLNEVADRLDSGEGDLTGWLIGRTPKWALEGLNPDAVDSKELVEEVVQRNLRVVLGAQFTEKEGERLIARAYNPSLDESVNASRLRRLVQVVEGRAQQMQSLNEFVTRNGTSAGWNGNLPTIDQIISEVEAAGRSGGKPAPNQKRKVFNPETGEFE